MGSEEAHIEEFQKFLAERGLRLTSQRRTIVEVFFSGERHQSLLELLAMAKERQPSIGYATVYRTMRLLTDGGLALEHKFSDNQSRYEPNEHENHHDHLICVECGKIVEFEDDVIERRQEKVAQELGFVVVSHRHEVYVRCLDTCVAEQDDL